MTEAPPIPGKVAAIVGFDCLTIDYTNHRGQRFARSIRRPTARFGTAEHHSGPPRWFIDAFCEAKMAQRTFDPVHINAWEGRCRSGCCPFR